MRRRGPRRPRVGSGPQDGRSLLPQVRPRSSGPSLKNTCMTGTSWIPSCRPSLVWAMMKKVEGRKSVTFAAGAGTRPQWAGTAGNPQEGRPHVLTCRDGHLGVDLVHKHLPAGFDRDDLGTAGSGVRVALGHVPAGPLPRRATSSHEEGRAEEPSSAPGPAGLPTCPSGAEHSLW